MMEALFDQLFDGCVMAVNALKTKNDVNEAVKAGKGKQHAKENATMSNSDLRRHAVASHFDNVVVANLNKVEDFNQLPDEWFAYLKDLKEDEPQDGLQTFIRNNYPDKSEYQQVSGSGEDLLRTKSIGKQATSEIVNVFNSLWKPNKIPSGRNVSDICRAKKIQRFRARAHRNAYHSMRRHKLVLNDDEWHDPEKLDYIRTTVAAKLKEFDPETKHLVFGSLFPCLQSSSKSFQ